MLVIALLAAAGWLVGFSSVLATERVTVSGTRLLSVDGVRKAAAVPIGLPLARQDTTAIAARVAGLAPVDTVTVDRSWPNTVSIKVAERTPAGRRQDSGGYQLVDHAGISFETVSLLPAGVVERRHRRRQRSAARRCRHHGQHDAERVASQVATISADAPDSFRVHLDSGLVITWGSADESALKGQVALLLLKQKPKAIDVSAPHSPAVR